MSSQETRPREGEPVRKAARIALRWMAWTFGAMVLLAGAVGWLVAGAAGVWGALLGIGIAVIFSGSTVATMWIGADKHSASLAGLVLGVWLAKILVLFGLLFLLQPLDFYHRTVFAVVICAAVVAAAIIDALAISRARIPLLDPGR